METFLQRSKSTLASSRVIPGSIESVCHLTRPSHALVCVVVNSEPPLLRMWSGTSLLTKRSLRRPEILAGQLPGRIDHQALPRELVDHYEDLQLTALLRSLRERRKLHTWFRGVADRRILRRQTCSTVCYRALEAGNLRCFHCFRGT